jgi:hypothetical protein
MTFLILAAVGAWVAALVFVISLCKAAKMGDRVHPPVRRNQW